MFKAIKDNKIIAINETGKFPCMVYDEVIEDTEHSVGDYVMVGTEFILKTDDKAIRQEKDNRIAELKQYLSDTDYWGQKYLDGEYTEEEWAEKVAQRKAWREEIRSLENDNLA